MTALAAALDASAAVDALRSAWAQSRQLRVVGVLAPGFAEAAMPALRALPYAPVHGTAEVRCLYFRAVFEPSAEPPYDVLCSLVADEVTALVRRITGEDLVLSTRHVAAIRYRKGTYLDPHLHADRGVRFEVDVAEDALVVHDLAVPHEVPIVDVHVDRICLVGVLRQRGEEDAAPPYACG